MRAIAVAVEGVLTRAPAERFAESAVNQDGLWLLRALSEGGWVQLVTGRGDADAVVHWMRSNGLPGWDSLLSPITEVRVPSWRSRLEVLIRLAATHRGNLVVVDSHPVIGREMLTHGALVITPTWSRVRSTVGENELMPLRPVRTSFGD